MRGGIRIGAFVMAAAVALLAPSALRQKGKLKVKVVYTPDGGLAATKKLTLRG